MDIPKIKVPKINVPKIAIGAIRSNTEKQPTPADDDPMTPVSPEVAAELVKHNRSQMDAIKDSYLKRSHTGAWVDAKTDDELKRKQEDVFPTPEVSGPQSTFLDLAKNEAKGWFRPGLEEGRVVRDEDRSITNTIKRDGSGIANLAKGVVGLGYTGAGVAKSALAALGRASMEGQRLESELIPWGQKAAAIPTITDKDRANFNEGAAAAKAMAAAPITAAGYVWSGLENGDPMDMVNLVTGSPINFAMNASAILPVGPKASIAKGLGKGAAEAFRAGQYGKAAAKGAAAVPVGVAESLFVPGEANLLNSPMWGIKGARGAAARVPGKFGDWVRRNFYNADHLTKGAADSIRIDPEKLGDAAFLERVEPQMAEATRSVRQGEMFPESTLTGKVNDLVDPTGKGRVRDAGLDARRAGRKNVMEGEGFDFPREPTFIDGEAYYGQAKETNVFKLMEEPQRAEINATFKDGSTLKVELPKGELDPRLIPGVLDELRAKDFDYMRGDRVRVSLDGEGFNAAEKVLAERFQSETTSAILDYINKMDVSPKAAAAILKHGSHVKLFDKRYGLPSMRDMMRNRGFTGKVQGTVEKMRDPKWQEKRARGEYIEDQGLLFDRFDAQLGETVFDLAQYKLLSEVLDDYIVSPVAKSAPVRAAAPEGGVLGVIAQQAKDAIAGTKRMRQVDLNKLDDAAAAIVADKMGGIPDVPVALADYIEWQFRKGGRPRGHAALGMEGPFGKGMDALQGMFVRNILFRLPHLPVGITNMISNNLGLSWPGMLRHNVKSFPKQYVKTLGEYLPTIERRPYGGKRIRSTADPNAIVEGIGLKRSDLWDKFGGRQATGVQQASRLTPWTNPKGVFGPRGYTGMLEDAYGMGLMSDMASKEAWVKAYMKDHPGAKLDDAIRTADETFLAYHKNPDYSNVLSSTFLSPFWNWTHSSTPAVIKNFADFPFVYSALRAAGDAGDMMRAAEEGINLQEKIGEYPPSLQNDRYMGQRGVSRVPGQKFPAFMNDSRYALRSTFSDAAQAVSQTDRGGDMVGRGLAALTRNVSPVATIPQVVMDAFSTRPVVDPHSGRDITAPDDEWYKRLAKSIGHTAKELIIPPAVDRAMTEGRRAMMGEVVPEPFGGELTKEGAIQGLIGPTEKVRIPELAMKKRENQIDWSNSDMGRYLKDQMDRGIISPEEAVRRLTEFQNGLLEQVRETLGNRRVYRGVQKFGE